MEPVLRVLDIGCGPKPYEPLFNGNKGTYWGLDIDTSSKADLVGQMESPPIRDGAVDVILCTQVFQSCRQPVGALKEMRRVLRPSGALLLSTPRTWLRDPAPGGLRGTGSSAQRRCRGVLDVSPGECVVGPELQSRFLAPVRGNYLLVARGPPAFKAVDRWIPTYAVHPVRERSGAVSPLRSRPEPISICAKRSDK